MMLSLAAISTYLPISKIIKTSLFAKVQISKYFIVGGSKIGSCQNANMEHSQTPSLLLLSKNYFACKQMSIIRYTVGRNKGTL